MPEITRILSWGSGEWNTLILTCGHKRKVRRAQVKAQQLMPGKQVDCEECPFEVPAAAEKYFLFNDTDGIFASPEPMTKAQAELFEKVFRERFELQGFYCSTNGRIPASDLKLRLIAAGDLNDEL